MKLYILWMLSAAGVASALAENQGSGVATVVRFNGSARWAAAGNDVWQELKAGDELPAGSVIEAGKEAGDYVDVALISSGGQVVEGFTEATAYTPASHPDGVRLLEDSRLRISKLNFMQTGDDVVADIRLKLERGHLVGLVKKRSPASRFEVDLPNGTAALRESAYDLSVDGIKAHGGGVIWRGEEGRPQTISVGQALDVHTGQISALSPNDKPQVANAAVALASVTDKYPILLSSDSTRKDITPVHPPHPPHPPHPTHPPPPPRGHG